MGNIYLTRPELSSHITQIAKVRTTPEGRLAVTLDENILRPAGGGQPQDAGAISWQGQQAPVGRIFKAEGETWLEVDGPMAQPLEPGAEVTLDLDAARRFDLSRCHSLTHLGMAAVRKVLAGYESKGADIAEDASGVTLYFRSDRTPSPADLYEVGNRMRSLIFQQVPIRVERAKSLEAAANAYPCWRVDPDTLLTGRIRVIHIEGVDANPCSGSHVEDTQAIGPFKMGACRVDGRGHTALGLQRLPVWMDW